MEPPGWVCQTSGGLLAARRVASTTCALLPAPPATAAFVMSTPGLPFLKPSKMTLRAALSDPDVHQEMTSSLLPAEVPLCPLPPHAARRSAIPAVPAATALRVRSTIVALLEPVADVVRLSREGVGGLLLGAGQLRFGAQVVERVRQHDCVAEGGHDERERRTHGVDHLALHQRHDRAADDGHHEARGAELGVRAQPPQCH